VTKSVAADAIVAGNPARVLRMTEPNGQRRVK
jgi:acetyltransferase-like isoleucine patch superfamily enzyme